MDGWIILDKPVGLGSTQAVGAVKRALREAGVARRKVGHGGTLDPLASGVLPIAIGEATKFCGRMLDADKGYDFTIAFGVETDTLDGEGKEVASGPLPMRDAVWRAIAGLRGVIEQMPPAYSALKIDGIRAYALARAGEDVELATRSVTIHDLYSTNRLGGTNLAADERLATAELRAIVSKGTYIRSLARDVAVLAGSVGHVSRLRRFRAGPFGTTHAISLDTLREKSMARDLASVLLPLEAGLDGIPALDLTPDQARLLRQGRTLIGNAAPGLHLARHAGLPVALVEADGPEIRVVRGLNPMPKED